MLGFISFPILKVTVAMLWVPSCPILHHRREGHRGAELSATGRKNWSLGIPLGMGRWDDCEIIYHELGATRVIRCKPRPLISFNS